MLSLNTYPLLSLSQREVLELAAAETAAVGQLHEVGGRVRPGAQYEHHRRERRRLLEYHVQTANVGTVLWPQLHIPPF